MMKIAIDPGATGSIVWGRTLQDVQVMNMPKTMGDIWDALSIINQVSTVCLMEKVGTYMPGNSGPSAATFAEHVGSLKMALIASGMPHELVTPQKWMKAYIGVPQYIKITQGPLEDDKEFKSRKRGILAKRKKERKDKIKAQSQMIFPHIKVTLLNADALGMYWYGMQELALWREEV